MRFPDQRPNEGNFNRPAEDETLDISPPGFCWWRVGPRGKFSYRLRVRSLEQHSRELEMQVAERTKQLEQAKNTAEAGQCSF